MYFKIESVFSPFSKFHFPVKVEVTQQKHLLDTQVVLTEQKSTAEKRLDDLLKHVDGFHADMDKYRDKYNENSEVLTRKISDMRTAILTDQTKMRGQVAREI